MEKLIQPLIDLVALFILIYFLYSVFINRKKKEYKDLKDNDPVKLFIAKYDLDVRVTNYKTILKVTTMINSFILAFSAVIVMNIEKMVWAIMIGFVVIMILMYSLNEIFGRLLKRKEVKKCTTLKKLKRNGKTSGKKKNVLK